MRRILLLFWFFCILVFYGCKESCDDGILNQDETFVDCGGICPTCETCVDGIQNGLEVGIDCGGTCAPCVSCFDGILNQDEIEVDCGGSCEACASCFDGILNQDEAQTDCGGSCLPCVASCPISYGETLTANLSFSQIYESKILESVTYELLPTGIQFDFVFQDSVELEFYHDYSLFEIGQHGATPLTTLELTDAEDRNYSSFSSNSSVFFFINFISSDISCRMITGSMNATLQSDDEEFFAFIGVQFNNFEY